LATRAVLIVTAAFNPRGEISGVTDDFISDARYEIAIANRRVPARASLTPMYDPKNVRVRQ
jgi:hypothetical protein